MYAEAIAFDIIVVLGTQCILYGLLTAKNKKLKYLVARGLLSSKNERLVNKNWLKR